MPVRGVGTQTARSLCLLGAQEGAQDVSASLMLCLPLTTWPWSAHRLLNANKINCIRPDAFQDLQNLSLLSLYDNKIQSLAKGTFTSLRAIQTL